MGKKKIYAVRVGRTTGLFDSWDACKGSVNGYANAEFKGFSTREEAMNYLNGMTDSPDPSAIPAKPDCPKEESRNEDPAKLKDLHPQHLIAYVDGSFDLQKKRYSFGCLLLEPDGSISRESGNGANPRLLEIRNVAGEMMGAMRAVRWAINHGYPSLEIRYDYAGIECWVTDAWEAKQDVTKSYENYMKEMREKISLRFQKVKAHSGHYYNEEADRLAKEALTEPLPSDLSLEDNEVCAEEEILLR